MSADPNFIREAVVWLICMLAMVGLGYWLRGLLGSRHTWDDGYVAGRNEERSHTNARVMRGKLYAFKDGIVTGMKRAEDLFHSKN